MPGEQGPVPRLTSLGPDFPFAYDDWLAHPTGLGTIPAERHGAEVAVIGAGISGLVAAYELMRMGLKPVIYESGQLGGRLRSQTFEGTNGIVAELGGMRFPRSSAAFYHYVDMLGLETRPFPNPLTAAAGSTVIDLEGETLYAETLADLPPLFREVASAYDAALEEAFGYASLRDAIARRDAKAVKALWDPLVPLWDERTFYDFVTTSKPFRNLSFRHREVFGQVGFGTGGWDSDFPNSMLEILRVNALAYDDDQHLIVGGAEQVPQGLWRHRPEKLVHWPEGTSLASLHGGGTRPGVTAINRAPAGQMAAQPRGQIEIVDRWGRKATYGAVIATCQSWLLTTTIRTEESLFSQKLWMALDRTRYMQSSKTFVMTDRPFWKDRDPATGRDAMSMTLTDRLTRGTYLFDHGLDEQGRERPGVICLTYSWMSDALKMLPFPAERRVELALHALQQIYPTLDIASHIISDPITVSWENDVNFLGAFKGALPGHYRYNTRMYGHFMQGDLPPTERGLFLAGDDISFTPAWVEGAVQTALNAVWGVMRQMGGGTAEGNAGPGDVWGELRPVVLGE